MTRVAVVTLPVVVEVLLCPTLRVAVVTLPIIVEVEVILPSIVEVEAE